MVPASLSGLCLSLAALGLGAAGSLSLPLPLPVGHCLFHLDPLSAVFLVPVFLLSALAALVLPGRMRPLEDQAHYGKHCFFFAFLAASMALVILAADGIFFLLLWEMMSLSPFFLIACNDKTSIERFASWIYLVAAHLGALPLLLLFMQMTVETGSSDFAYFLARGEWRSPGLLFVLALIGFGAKAGLFPLHMWMPEAHSSAPGHVAVLLSGTMLNVGIYGIVRVAVLLGAGGAWQASLLMGAGALSGVLGILLALGQSDMKRTLAYSSAENMGIILLAFGGGLLAAGHGAAAAASLLFGGAFLHMWNHSVFKSLLFLGANAVKESVHATSVHRLGGLHKRMPFTGACFAAGSAAIAGLPPFNGFMGELLVYFGFALGAEATRGAGTALLFWLGFIALGCIAGMALFAFTRMFGLIFLGAPRAPEAREAREPEPLLQRVMLVLAALCIGICLVGPFIFDLFEPLLRWLARSMELPVAFSRADFAVGGKALGCYALAGICLGGLFWGLMRLRRRFAEREGAGEAVTWGCGYPGATARMQYSGGSFVHSLALMLRPLIRPHMRMPEPGGFFPGPGRAVMSVPDWPTAVWNRALFRPVTWLAENTKDVQHGFLNVYILYILVALIAALVWALGWS